MSLKGFGIAGLVALAASGQTDALGKPGLRPAPCPNQKWEPGDPAFETLAGPKASFGRYDGGGSGRASGPKGETCSVI